MPWAGDAHFEHNMALALRAITFAARKEPTLTPTLKNLERPAAERGPATVTLTAPAKIEATAADSVVVRVELQ